MSTALQQIAVIAQALIAIMLLVVVVLAVPVLLELRRMLTKADAVMGRLSRDFEPIIRHGTVIADNLEHVSQSVRTEVDRVNHTIERANDRVRRAVDETEARVGEFNALLQVVQEEAEQFFVSTASTVRGVREGAAELRGDGGRDLASEESDAAIPADDIESEENGHGDDSDPEPPAQAFSAPRVRPRPRASGGAGRRGSA
jgi:uncharacterized protein YoxC